MKKVYSISSLCGNVKIMFHLMKNIPFKLSIVLTLIAAPGKSAVGILSDNAPRDSFIIVNKSKLFYKLTGTGKPIVFVSGFGEDHSSWDVLTNLMKGYALTLSYDRCGLGRSDYNAQKKDLISMTRELNELLKKLHFPEKFIIVGHSLGCQIVKKYITMYPSRISGVVFVDPGYNENNLKKMISAALWIRREQQLKKYVPLLNLAQKEKKRT